MPIIADYISETGLTFRKNKRPFVLFFEKYSLPKQALVDWLDGIHSMNE